VLNVDYDPGLVILSILIAVFVSFTSLGLVSRIPHLEKHQVLRWLAGGSISMGSGIWSMHFVGMLAFHLPIPVAYDPGLTLVSVLIAIGGSAIALSLVRNGISSQNKLYASAALMAAAICAMHYTGMYSMQMVPGIQYSPALVALSYLIAYWASLFALGVTFGSKQSQLPLLFSRKNLFGALFMGCAIAGMHYVGMGAAAFPAGSICLAAPGGLAGGALAMSVSGITLGILLLTLVVLAYDVRFAEAQALNLETLKLRNQQLENRAREQASKMIRQIRESAKQDRLLATIVEQSHDAVITTDLDGRITTWNPAAEGLFGYSSQHATGATLQALIPDSLRQAVGSRTQAGETNESLVTLHNHQGRELHIGVSIAPLLDESGERSGSVIVLRDLTDERRNTAQLTLWSKVFEHSGEAIMITDADNRLISVNKAFTDITGYSAEEVLGKNPQMFASEKQDQAFYRSMWDDIVSKGMWKGEIWNRHKDGHLIPEWLSITTLTDADGRISNHIAIFTDATTYKEKEAHIEHLAHHDMLTGLPNRVLLHDRLKHAIAAAQRQQQMIAVMFIDLDRFKLINDTLGHHVGDKLLQEVANRLQAATREEDTVSRQGGDEFIIVTQGLAKAADATIIAENLVAALSREYRIDEQTLTITPSIGISLYPLDADNGDALIRNADTAMYHAKDLGRANFQFFTAQLNQVLSERLQLEQELRAAVDGQAFTLYYQPQLSLSDNRVHGVEVLLRWFHPTLGAISPARFITLAEDINLIQSLGNWVLEQSISVLAGWNDDVFGDLQMSINISPRQLETPGFCAHIEGLIRKYQVAPERIKLEITETALMHDVELSVRHLNLLRELRVQISVDDFGTGYSSMNYLKRFPINELKIDRDFIEGVDCDVHDEAISRAVITLAETLGLDIIAEGVETEAQSAFLRRAGCPNAQGYLFAAPMPYQELMAFVRRRQTEQPGADPMESSSAG